ncbi:hypothetical protein Pryu01_02866 [Paraliobacillus ryukyuensis]|uniref:GntR family transcriptional regulator n=1 Tax=Paraliobacillus ryukyuensis TaxID=200904 RepID=A0A366DZ66_9BACI|nr:GntR family transcriptional regulator [Paraliobacillus ryukyuensis]RBO95373.1 GntR family transcriptional regulator [Paraliobacillus ryukyuensis]
MKLDDSRPIFQQIKEYIEDMIINETLAIEERVPSTNEFAKYYKINPATAAKGINELVDEGIIYKKRGVGMFVTEQAKEIVFQKRKSAFVTNYITPMKQEAAKLGLSYEDLVEMVTKEEEHNEN